MANSLLDLLIQKCENHPDYEWYTELFNRLDPTASPRIELVHRAELSISERGKKLGIFSGSFNPLTLAHTKMIEDTVAEYELDELLLLLAKANVDKTVFGLPLAARLLTLERYTKSRERFSVGVSSHGRYIDKVTALKADFTTRNRVSLYRRIRYPRANLRPEILYRFPHRIRRTVYGSPFRCREPGRVRY